MDEFPWEVKCESTGKIIGKFSVLEDADDFLDLVADKYPDCKFSITPE